MERYGAIESVLRAEIVELGAALDAEREKVKELECYRALWKRRDDELTGVLAQRAALQARATELERDNAAMKQLFDANPSALWAQLATLQAQLAAEQHRADRAVQDRRDALDVKTKEGMSCSEWLMRTATAERQVNELKAQLWQVEEALDEALGALGYPVPADTPSPGRYKCGLCEAATLAAQDVGKVSTSIIGKQVPPSQWNKNAGVSGDVS
jgi:DNA repair exonuclease SbcCD ATPase subunit